MQPRKYQTLLPATTWPAEDESPSSNAQSPSKEEPKKGGNGKPVACNECRRRKTKCDGQHPMCSNCRKRGLRACIYAEKLQLVPEVLVEVVKRLRVLDEDRAVDLLRILRANDDPATALSVFEGDREGARTQAVPGPDHEAPPPARNSLESELMTYSPTMYPALYPVVPSELAESQLLRSSRSPGPGSEDQRGSPSVDADSSLRQSRFANAPKQEIDYCDKRLAEFDVSFWTDIEITNDLAARIISLYIRTDHPLLGLFSPDLFISDLVGKQDTHCSRFLFHALMYLGCQMYSAFDKSTIQVTDKFCSTAEELWETEKNNYSYSSMAGAVLLSLCLIGHGRDHAVHYYAHAALTIGTQIGLFDKDFPLNERSRAKMPQEVFTARCYAAWGAFNWNVLVCIFYRQPGSECPVSTPALPIPGDSISRTGAGTHSLDHECPARDALLGDTFPALCHFWRIVHGAKWIYYPEEQSPPKKYEMNLAEHKFRELIAWVERLPRSLARTEKSPHHVDVFHIWLHCVILDLFRRFKKKTTDEEYRLVTFSTWNSSPSAAFAASVNQLKSLIVEHRTKFRASAYSILWHSGLIYLANGVLQDTSDPEWRIYFLLCIYAYENLGRPYRISGMVAQGLLSMSLRDTNITAYEAREIMEDLRERGLDHVKKNMEEEIRATFMVDLTLALDDPVEATVENMARQFDSLALFQEIMDQDKMEM